MDAAVARSIDQFNFTDILMPKLKAGLTREHLLHRAGPTSNPLIWMFGHLATIRFRTGNVLGPEEPVPMEQLFGQRSRVEHLIEYPKLDSILDYYEIATKRMYERLEAATPELLDKNSPRSTKSIRHIINVVAYHEAMLVGQMAFARKLVGLDSDDPVLD